MLFQVLTETFSSPVPVPPETARTVDVWAVEKALGSAGFELDHWLGHKFTDMFTLLNTEGEWKIISKVFYLHPES